MAKAQKAITVVEKQAADLSRWIAFLVATGMRNQEIIEKTGASREYLLTLKSSPLFHAVVAQHRKELLQNGYEAVAARLLADAPKTLDFLQKVRDGQYNDEDPKVLRFRMDAAEMLLKRQAPERPDQGLKSSLPVNARQEKDITDDCLEAGIRLDDAIEQAKAALPPLD